MRIDPKGMSAFATLIAPGLHLFVLGIRHFLCRFLARVKRLPLHPALDCPTAFNHLFYQPWNNHQRTRLWYNPAQLTMNKAIAFFREIEFKEQSIPVALLIANILAFGLLLPFLGYYQDDWHSVYYAFTRGAQGLWELFDYDGHPLSAWSYIIGFRLLGFKPIYWHLLSLAWRWLASVTFWLCIRTLWPRRSNVTFTAAILFAIYPLFSLQSQAISYVEVWFSFFLVNLSFYFTVKAVKEKDRFWINTALALGLKLIQIFTSEYFAGIEFVRPVLIYLALRDVRPKEFKKLVADTLKLWSPYLLASGLFTIWRIFFYVSPFAKQNAPVLIQALLKNPAQTFQYIFLSAIPDFVLILVGSWTNLFTPALYDFSERAKLAFFAVSFIGIVLAVFFLNHLQDPDAEYKNDSNRDSIALGLVALVFAMLPAYAANYFIYTENPPWGSRFGIPAMFGAALIIATLIHSVITSSRTRNLVVAVLFGLSVGWNLNNANSFRLVWEKEANFFNQLVWRVPSIQPNTAIITEQEILAYMGDYPMGFSINAMYSSQGVSTGKSIPYWYFSLQNNFGDQIQDFLNGEQIGAKKFSVRFTGDSTKNLILTFAPEKGECLRLIRPDEAGAPYLSPLERQVSKFSAPERVSPESNNPLHDIIFGNDPPKGWCYYYEKAQLRRDREDWKGVIQYWEEAKSKGLKPGNDVEYLPFIEAYSNLGDWSSAADILGGINLNQKTIRPSLCFLWKNVEQETPPSPKRDRLLSQSPAQLNCGQ